MQVIFIALVKALVLESIIYPVQAIFIAILYVPFTLSSLLVMFTHILNDKQMQ